MKEQGVLRQLDRIIRNCFLGAARVSPLIGYRLLLFRIDPALAT